MKQEVLGWLIVARSGYGHFAAYHEKFNHKEATDTHCTEYMWANHHALVVREKLRRPINVAWAYPASGLLSNEELCERAKH